MNCPHSTGAYVYIMLIMLIYGTSVFLAQKSPLIKKNCGANFSENVHHVFCLHICTETYILLSQQYFENKYSQLTDEIGHVAPQNDQCATWNKV